MIKATSSGHLLVNVAVALFAGVAGSLLTLLVTGSFKAPPDHQSAVDINDTYENRTDHSPTQLLAESDEPFVVNRDDYVDTEVSQALVAATEERAQLAQVLAQLTRQVETLESDMINREAMDALERASESASEPLEFSGFGNEADFGQSLNGQDRIDTLVSVGIDLQTAQALQSRQDEYQLARLELFDQAEREGWIDSEQFSDRLNQLNERRPDLREELGDAAYDRYLFEAGRSNRVVIASIIPGSAAAIAGLEPGDLVISYADRRVFSTNDLQRATRSGVRGESVSVNIDRQGQSLFFELQRGPLGVTLRQDQRNPS